MQFNQIANNSISNYNKIFSKEMESFNISSDKNGMTAFDNVLNQQMDNMAHTPQGPIINTGIQMNVGLENMGVSPLERIDNAQGVQETQKRSKSAVENMANDFGKAFSNGLNSVNDSQNAAYEAVQMAIQMRNRLVNAYNEINNVRV